MTPYLRDIFWHSLSGPQACFAEATPSGRERCGAADPLALRYARGFSPIVAFRDRTDPDFGALGSLCLPGEALYCDGWSGLPPSGWRIEHQNTMFKMVWAGGRASADPLPEAVMLDSRHAAAALALAELTHPGPFGLRTIELGEYFGVFAESGRLIAMAGERSQAGGYREISGVCTHPDHQGRGLARRLVALLLQRQLARAETPFLHVMTDNERAHALYLRMGFRDDQVATVRVIAREEAG
jgi:ribosomal protein S18 acetylase RimI-like enzyme